jgi:hypothetical protein
MIPHFLPLSLAAALTRCTRTIRYTIGDESIGKVNAEPRAASLSRPQVRVCDEVT